MFRNFKKILETCSRGPTPFLAGDQTLRLDDTHMYKSPQISSLEEMLQRIKAINDRSRCPIVSIPSPIVNPVLFH